MSSTIINQSEVRWIGPRGLDPIGRVFQWNDAYFRTVRIGKGAHVRRLFDEGIVKKLMDRGWLIPTEISKYSMEGAEMILSHRLIPFETFPQDWSRSMLLDAAEIWLRINLELLPHNLGLVDGHGGNFAQLDNAQLIWMDFGSISPISKSVMGMEEFRRWLANPVSLIAARPQIARMVRSSFRDEGVSDAEAEAILGKPKWSVGRFMAGRAIANETTVSGRRKLLLESGLARLPKSLKPPGTFWQAYQENNPTPPDENKLNARRTAVRGVLRDLKPRTVADLAANEGFFSFMAARHGATVFALDFDEGAVESLYRHAKQSARSMSVTAAWANVLVPRRREPRADLAMALALTHHLALGQKYRWEYPVKCLASYTSDALLTEFMPNGLAGREKPKDPLPEWYTLEAFMAALEVQFREVKILDYPASPEAIPRTMILCKGCRMPA